MGNKWTVEVFRGWSSGGVQTGAGFTTVWQGESLLGALWALWKHRNEGTGCVTLSYRRSQNKA